MKRLPGTVVAVGCALRVLGATNSSIHVDSVTAGQVTAGQVSGDGAGLTGVVVAPIGTRAAWYVAPRTDGKAGSGAFNDPFDGSTPAGVAAVWEEFLRVQQPGKRLVFQPGSYVVTNCFRLPAGARSLSVLGHGAALVYSNGAAIGTFTLFESQFNPATGWMHYQDDVTIEGFDCDLGSAVRFVGDGKTCGLVGGGRGFQVRDLVFRNLTSYSTKDPVQECFATCMDATNGSVRVRVENFVAPTGRGGCTAVGVGGEGNLVSGCVVNLGDRSPENGFYTFAFGCFGSRNVYSGNVAQGCDMGFAMDNAGNGLQDGSTWRDNVFVGNSVSATLIGFRIHPSAQRYENWLIVGNVFCAEPGAMWIDFQKHGGELSESNRVTGMTLVGNQFSGSPRAEGNFNFSHFQWHSLIGNSFTAPASMRTGTNSTLQVYRLGNSLNGRLYEP